MLLLRVFFWFPLILIHKFVHTRLLKFVSFFSLSSEKVVPSFINCCRYLEVMHILHILVACPGVANISRVTCSNCYPLISFFIYISQVYTQMKVFVSVLLLLFQLETNFKTQTALSSKTIIIIFVPFLFILQCGKKTRIKKITKIFTSFLIINSLTVLILAA